MHSTKLRAITKVCWSKQPAALPEALCIESLAERFAEVCGAKPAATAGLPTQPELNNIAHYQCLRSVRLLHCCEACLLTSSLHGMLSSSMEPPSSLLRCFLLLAGSSYVEY